MGTRDPRIDAYIAKSPDFAQPILTHLRDVVHGACPAIEETMKWSTPHFVYGGASLCHMAAFKQHAAFGFWKGSLVVDVAPDADKAAGQFGRLTAIADLPSKRALAGYVKKAMQLTDDGVKAPTRTAPKAKKPDAVVPAYLAAALRANAAAQARFDAFSPSHRREYIEWLADAKTDATRERRLAQAIEWIAEGKGRNWKYQ
jgi:uncharacterized protein YdeI (YjbR/CyaY-like superfamily)